MCWVQNGAIHVGVGWSHVYSQELQYNVRSVIPIIHTSESNFQFKPFDTAAKTFVSHLNTFKGSIHSSPPHLDMTESLVLSLHLQLYRHVHINLATVTQQKLCLNYLLECLR